MNERLKRLYYSHGTNVINMNCNSFMLSASVLYKCPTIINYESFLADVT